VVGPLLLVPAFALEAGSLFFLAAGNQGWSMLAVFLALHTLACGLLSQGTWALLPAVLRRPKKYTALLFGMLSFFIPGLGCVGVTLVAVFLRRNYGPRLGRQFTLVPLPTFELFNERDAPPSSVRLRTHITSGAPVDTRIRALLSMQHMPIRYAARDLREAMAEPVDELRLLAYRIRESYEKRLMERIHRMSEKYEASADTQTKAVAAKSITELYVELIYQNLVEGQMRRYALEQAMHYSLEATATLPNDAGLWVIRGRACMLANDYQAAEHAFSRAIENGIPDQKVRIYLAELAFQRQEFGAVRRIAADLRQQGTLGSWQSAIDYW